MALKDDRVEQCLRSCGSEFQMRGPKKETEGTKAMSLACGLVDFQHAADRRRASLSTTTTLPLLDDAGRQHRLLAAPVHSPLW